MPVLAEATAIRPFRIEVARGAARRPAPPGRGDALAHQGARRRSVAGRAAGDAAGARPLLDDRVRLAQVRGAAERAAAVHDRDRRGRDPLHPRQVAARERAAADHDARLARLGHRAARDRRPADRPDRARRHRRGRVPPGAAVLARLRLLGRADRARLGVRPHRPRLGGADEPPRLHALRRPGRRRGRRSSRTRWAARRPRGCSASTSTCSRRRSASPINCRRSPSRNARRTRRSRRSGRTASATSWSSPPGRRRSATRCWIHPSGWRPGCSTTTRTATTRSPARSSTASPRAISPGTTSSTTSRCTG